MMLPKRLIEGLDKTRLRNFLVLFFVALAVPTGVLIWQAYSQLQWAAFHQYQTDATELTQRIDSRLNELIRTADTQTFADYTFLNVSGDPSAKFVQRSPLSAYPVEATIPGVLGYFQVDTNGNFSTPLLPPDDAEPASFGIGDAELDNRQRLAREINIVLADNRLAQPQLVQIGDLSGEKFTYSDGASVVPEEEKAGYAGGLLSPPVPVDEAAATERVELAQEPGPSTDSSYSQLVFDKLSEPQRSDASARDSKGDADLSAQLENAERQFAADLPSEQDDNEDLYYLRRKRTEQSALPEAVGLEANEEEIANIAGLKELRISTFESEIDPFEFGLLDSGHLVLFRKVWRDGERYIQGLLLDREVFAEAIIGASFMATALADITSLDVLHQDDVIHTFDRLGSNRSARVPQDLVGDLLYRSRLTAPLDSLELVFHIKQLPPGAGASVLGWATLVLAIVFGVGFVTLYRSGISQIELARQQQDFVSAVSHELKSPLTSIRMYGEMLKEGWANDEKRQRYYEFIHDESERLSRLISNVLQLANITRNEPQFDLKPTNVAELMSNIESKIASQIEQAGFELTFNIDPDAGRASINVDSDCFAQMIINLVDNAIKFSRDADSKIVEVSGRRSNDNQVLFSVRDYGPGVAKDQMKKIFKLFYRTESELTRETVGTGIGLAIVHQLASAMDGSVDMVNADPGAEFRFWFPVVDQD